LYLKINAALSGQAQAWFDGLEAAILSLDENPLRSPATPEDARLRHLYYGHGRNIYRVIYRVNASNEVVTIVHIRHGARQRMRTSGPESVLRE